MNTKVGKEMEAQLEKEGSSGPCRSSPAGMLARFARLTRPGADGLGLGMRIGAALRGDGMVGSVYIGRRIGWKGEEKGDGKTMLPRRITGEVAAVNIRALDPDGFSVERHS